VKKYQIQFYIGFAMLVFVPGFVVKFIGALLILDACAEERKATNENKM
jgi:UPF0716 family protein affecting phage T7 exclusion